MHLKGWIKQFYGENIFLLALQLNIAAKAAGISERTTLAPSKEP